MFNSIADKSNVLQASDAANYTENKPPWMQACLLASICFECMSLNRKEWWPTAGMKGGQARNEVKIKQADRAMHAGRDDDRWVDKVMTMQWEYLKRG